MTIKKEREMSKKINVNQIQMSSIRKVHDFYFYSKIKK